MRVPIEYLMAFVFGVGIVVGIGGNMAAGVRVHYRREKQYFKMRRAYWHLFKKYRQLEADYRGYQEKMETAVEDLNGLVTDSDQIISDLIAERADTDKNGARIDRSIERWEAKKYSGMQPYAPTETNRFVDYWREEDAVN